jgi:hypothetical protein
MDTLIEAQSSRACKLVTKIIIIMGLNGTNFLNKDVDGIDRLRILGVKNC